MGITLASTAQARVFNLAKESFASYLSLSYGPSRIEQNAFMGESAATDYSASVSSNQSGEFGFIYVTSRISWRFGFEVLRAGGLSDVQASNGGVNSYLLRSDVTAYLPKVGLELNLRTTNASRVFLFGHFGTGTLAATNDYSDVSVAPGSSFTMKYKGAATSQGAGLGYEVAAFDTTSILFEAGYRQMTFDKVVYSEDGTGFQGPHAAGDQVLHQDGRRREIDFSGGYVTIGARWYLF